MSSVRQLPLILVAIDFSVPQSCRWRLWQQHKCVTLDTTSQEIWEQDGGFLYTHWSTQISTTLCTFRSWYGWHKCLGFESHKRKVWKILEDKYLLTREKYFSVSPDVGLLGPGCDVHVPGLEGDHGHGGGGVGGEAEVGGQGGQQGVGVTWASSS